MGQKQEKKVNRHLTHDELNSIIKREGKSVRILERLCFIRFLYKGDTTKEACERISITEPTGYSWLKAWNDSGYKGLEPHFSGGAKPKLGSAERIELFRREFIWKSMKRCQSILSIENTFELIAVLIITSELWT
jgi:transposase